MVHLGLRDREQRGLPGRTPQWDPGKPESFASEAELLLAELLKTVDLRDKLLGEKYKEENILCQEELIGKNVQNILNVEEKKCKIQ